MPDAFLLSLTPTALAAIAPTSSILGYAGVGISTNLDFLWIKDDPAVIHAYIAPGAAMGTYGTMLTAEVGGVWRVKKPDDFTKWFLSASASVMFPGVRFSGGLWDTPFFRSAARGASATVFYDPMNFHTGSYGVSFGFAMGGTSSMWQPMDIVGGIGYASTVSYYFHLGAIPVAPIMQAAMRVAQDLAQVGRLILDAVDD